MNSLQSSALIAAALASITACYAVSLRAANERTAIVEARTQIARDTSDLRLLRAELRTRSRLPELQRWNEQVLALAAPRAEQLVTDTVQLASYAVPRTTPAPTAPVATVAVMRDAPVTVPALRRASFLPKIARDLGTDAALAGGAGIVRVAYQKVTLP